MVTYEDLPDAIYKFHARARLLNGGQLVTTTRKFRPGLEHWAICINMYLANSITLGSCLKHSLSGCKTGDYMYFLLGNFYPPDNNIECSVHLINNGLTVSGNTIVVEFAFFGDYTRCKLDDEDFKDCKLSRTFMHS